MVCSVVIQLLIKTWMYSVSYCEIFEKINVYIGIPSIFPVRLPFNDIIIDFKALIKTEIRCVKKEINCFKLIQ